jgi:hypothetical protein
LFRSVIAFILLLVAMACSRRALSRTRWAWIGFDVVLLSDWSRLGHFPVPNSSGRIITVEQTHDFSELRVDGSFVVVVAFSIFV